MNKGYIYILLLFSAGVFAQEKTIDSIQEVYLVAAFSPKYQVGYNVVVVSDSVLKSSSKTLTNLLRGKGNAYIKEYGNGMIASISMRGSSASHTGVYWNGIPINSSLNGQTDFNTIIPAMYNKLTIRKGGGSVLLGSGAVGGAINLENIFNYKNHTAGAILVSYGSYNSKSVLLNTTHSYDDLALQIGFSENKSKNNYPYLNTDLINENGEIKNTSFTFGIGRQINSNNEVYIKGITNFSNRNTSGTLYMTSNANLVYTAKNYLSGWKYTNKNYQLHLKSAYSKEQYKYIFNKNFPDFISDNLSNKWLHGFDYTQKINTNIKVFSGLSYEVLKGNGTAIATTKQQKLALYSWLHHRVSDKFRYNMSIRKEWSDRYEIPIVYAFDTRLKWAKQHSTFFNISTNYRTPTLNDLYWNFGGNTDLTPEESWTAELGEEWRYKENIQLGVSAFTTKSENLIQWKPAAGYWKPFNIRKVNAKGLEVDLEFTKSIHKFKLNLTTQYSYTITKDLATQKQLMYTPQNLGNSTLSLAYENIALSYDIQHTDKVYVTSSNTQFVAASWVNNTQLAMSFFKKKLNVNLAVNNVLNKAYQIYATRPMPNRNYNISVHYKF